MVKLPGKTPPLTINALAQSPGFALRLQQGQNIVLADGSLDVADDLAVRLVQELNLDLGTLSLASGTAEHFQHAS